jgi:hypothetical protein
MTDTPPEPPAAAWPWECGHDTEDNARVAYFHDGHAEFVFYKVSQDPKTKVWKILPTTRVYVSPEMLRVIEGKRPTDARSRGATTKAQDSRTRVQRHRMLKQLQAMGLLDDRKRPTPMAERFLRYYAWRHANLEYFKLLRESRVYDPSLEVPDLGA